MIDNKMSKFIAKIFFDLGDFDEEVFLEKLSCVDFEVGGVYVIDVLILKNDKEGVYPGFDCSIKVKRTVFVLEKQSDRHGQLMSLFKEICFGVYCNELTGHLVSENVGLMFDSFYISIKKFI